MTARAPQAIWNLWFAIHRDIPKSLLGGIVGDVQHSFGYHLARRDLPSTDYSVQLAKDKLGPNDTASALDVTLPPDLMITCTKRLLVAAKAKDPRLAALREFCGTTNGINPHPFDLHSGTDDPTNTQGWDDSHLFHIHLSFYREFATDTTGALLPIAQVIAGIPAETEFTMDAEAKQAFAALNTRIDGLVTRLERVEADAKQGAKVVDLFSDWEDPPKAHKLSTWLRGINGGDYTPPTFKATS